MPKQIVNISDTIKQFQEKFNTLSTDLGWRGRLTTTEDSDVVGAINEVDTRLDSINNTLINSAMLHMRDSSAENDIKGALHVHSATALGDTLAVTGAATYESTLLVKGNATFQGSTITLGNASSDNVVFTADVNSNIVPNTDSAYDLGSSTQQWRNLYIDGVGFIDNVQADDMNVTGTVTVAGLTKLNGNVDIGNATTDTVSITARIDTDLVPSTDNAVSLGSSSLEFKHLYLDGTAFVDDVTADSATIGTMKVSDLTNNRVVIAGASGEIEDDANFTFNGTQLNIGTGNFTVQQSSGNVYAAGELTVGDSAEFRSNVVVDGNTNLAGELRVGDSAEFNNNVVIDGNLNVGGNTTLQGTLVVDGQVTFKAGSDNNIALGDASTDTISLTGEVNSNIIPDSDRKYDLGSSSKEWKDLYVDGIGYIDEVNADSATITGKLTVGGLTTLNGNVDIGNATSDTVSVTGRFDTNLLPSTDNARDLGSASREWRHLFIDGTASVDKLAADSATVDANLTVGGHSYLDSSTVDGTLDVSDSAAFGDNVSIDGNVVIGGTVRSNSTAFKISADSASTDNVNLSDTIRISGGEGIDAKIIADKHIRVQGELASTSNIGVAKFNSNDFSVSSGNVSIKSSGVSNAQIANSYINITGDSSGTDAVNLGETLAVVGGTGVSVNRSNNQLKVNIDASGITNTMIANSYWTVADSAGGTYQIDLGDTLNLKGEGQRVRVSKGADDTIKFTLDSDVRVDGDLVVHRDASVGRDFTVAGNLIVSGATRITAHKFKMGEGTTGDPTLNGVLSIDRGTEDSAELVWNETQKYWTIGTNTNSDSDNGAGQRRIARWGDDLEVSNLTVDSDLTVNGANTTLNTNLYVHDSAKFNDDVSIAGNLTVNGTTTTINTTNLAIEDNVVVLNSNQTGTPATTLRAGIEVERGNETNAKLQFNENTDNWEFTGPKTGTLAVTGDIKNAQITITGGTYLSNDETDTNFTVNQSGNQTITLNHDATTRTDTTSTDTPGYGGTFEAVTGVTTNTTGHVTAIDVSTVTFPSVFSVAFNDLTSKTSGTSEYSTSGTLTAGRGSGGVSLTVNDGYGNANVAFNHKSGIPEQDGTSARIVVNTDNTTEDDGTMTFQVKGGTTAAGGAQALNTIITLTEAALDMGVDTISRTGSLTIDASGDITLDADGNDIIFKNGGGADTVTHTLANDATYKITAPSTYTVDATGDIVLDADGNDILFKNGAGADTVTHTLEDNANYIVAAPARYRVTSGGDMQFNATGDMLFNVDGNDIIFRGDSDTNDEIRFNLDGTEQTIIGTDNLKISAGEGTSAGTEVVILHSPARGTYSGTSTGTDNFYGRITMQSADNRSGLHFGIDGYALNTREQFMISEGHLTLTTRYGNPENGVAGVSKPISPSNVPEHIRIYAGASNSKLTLYSDSAEYVAFGGDLKLNASGDVHITSGDVKQSRSGTNTYIIENTDTTPSEGFAIGQTQYYGYDDAAAKREFARVVVRNNETAAADYSARYEVLVAGNGVLEEAIRIDGNTEGTQTRLRSYRRDLILEHGDGDGVVVRSSDAIGTQSEPAKLQLYNTDQSMADDQSIGIIEFVAEHNNTTFGDSDVDYDNHIPYAWIEGWAEDVTYRDADGQISIGVLSNWDQLNPSVGAYHTVFQATGEAGTIIRAGGPYNSTTYINIGSADDGTSTAKDDITISADNVHFAVNSVDFTDVAITGLPGASAGSISSNELNSAVELRILDASGTELKSIWGAGG